MDQKRSWGGGLVYVPAKYQVWTDLVILNGSRRSDASMGYREPSNN
jgi:hypothetical protein